MKDKKNKTKDRDKLKNVGFVETNEKQLADEDTKSLRSLCFVIDTEKDTLSVISGKFYAFFPILWKEIFINNTRYFIIMISNI